MSQTFEGECVNIATQNLWVDTMAVTHKTTLNPRLPFSTSSPDASDLRIPVSKKCQPNDMLHNHANTWIRED